MGREVLKEFREELIAEAKTLYWENAEIIPGSKTTHVLLVIILKPLSDTGMC